MPGKLNQILSGSYAENSHIRFCEDSTFHQSRREEFYSICAYGNRPIKAIGSWGIFRIVFISGFISLFTIENSYAYIDPGTGGMIVQIIAAAIVSSWVVIRLYWSKLRNIFKRKKLKNDSSSSVRTN